MCRVRIDKNNTDIYYNDLYLQHYIDYTNMAFKTCLTIGEWGESLKEYAVDIRAVDLILIS